MLIVNNTMVKTTTHEWALQNDHAYQLYADAKNRARIKFIEQYKIAYYKRKFTDQAKAPKWCPPGFSETMAAVDTKIPRQGDKIYLCTFRIPECTQQHYEYILDMFSLYKAIPDDLDWQFEDKKKDGSPTGLHVHAYFANTTAQSKSQIINSMKSAYHKIQKGNKLSYTVNDHAFDVKTLKDINIARNYVYKNVSSAAHPRGRSGSDGGTTPPPRLLPPGGEGWEGGKWISRKRNKMI